MRVYPDAAKNSLPGGSTVAILDLRKGDWVIHCHESDLDELAEEEAIFLLKISSLARMWLNPN